MGNRQADYEASSDPVLRHVPKVYLNHDNLYKVVKFTQGYYNFCLGALHREHSLN